MPQDLQEGAYDIYTEVGKYIGWIERIILSNGGMNSCGYTIAATSTVQVLAAATTPAPTTAAPTGQPFHNMFSWYCSPEMV